MKIKKILISLMALVIVASQFTGCADSDLNNNVMNSEESLIATTQSYDKDNDYSYSSTDKDSTDTLESDAKALWEKQDKNDMSCTEEEFIEDYVTAVGSGSMTPEAFEESIEGRYSIAFAEKQAEEDKQVYIDSLWECYGEDKLTCDKETFAKEYNAYREEKGDSYNEEDFATYIKEKYGKQETEETEATDKTDETDSSIDNDDSTSDNNSNSGNNVNNGNNSNGNSNNSGNSGNTSNNNDTVYTPPVDNSSSNNDTPVYTPPAQQEPVYTPPVDNGGSSDWEDWGGSSGFGQNKFNPDLIEMS